MGNKWLPMDAAPTDGTPIIGLTAGEETEIRWSEHRECMMAGLGTGTGTFGPGWEDVVNGLVVYEEPEGWRPVTAVDAIRARLNDPVDVALNGTPYVDAIRAVLDECVRLSSEDMGGMNQAVGGHFLELLALGLGVPTHEEG